MKKIQLITKQPHGQTNIVCVFTTMSQF